MNLLGTESVRTYMFRGEFVGTGSIRGHKVRGDFWGTGSICEDSEGQG